METKHFKGHLMRAVARKAHVSTEYVNLLAKGEREANSETAQKILKAAKLYESALEAVDKQTDKIFA